MSEQTKLTAQEILRQQRKQDERLQDLEERLTRLASQDPQQKSHQVISIGRLGRELFPTYFARESMLSATLKAGKESESFGDTEAEVSAEIDIPSNEKLFLWGVGFGQWKNAEDPNVGLRNTWLPLSGDDVSLYPHTTPEAEIDWRYTGRDFEWAMSENAGKANLQNGWRPSSDAKGPYGYILAEEMFLKSGTKFVVKARPLGAVNMWLPDGTQQKYTLNVYLRCYEMVKPLNKRGE